MNAHPQSQEKYSTDSLYLLDKINVKQTNDLSLPIL